MIKTKILVEINDLEHGLKLIESQKYSIVLNVKDVSYTKQFNCYLNELKLLSNKANELGVELFANVDMLFHEDDLTGLKAILKRIYQMNFKGVIISDVGIIELAKELNLNFNFINGGSILNTNYESININSSFYTGFFVSNEINISEIEKIIERNKSELFIQIFGKQKMFYSKRRLLTSYFENFKIPLRDFHPRNHLVISDQNEKDNLSYIYEDSFGTYIYTFFDVNGLDYVKEFKNQNVDYLYISNLFKEKVQYNQIILAFYNYLNDLISYEQADEIIKANSAVLSKSFFEDASVYTIEKTKLLEASQKNE